MIEEGELLIQLHMALDFNRILYPCSTFSEKPADTSLTAYPHSHSLSSTSKVATMIAQAVELVKDKRKIQLTKLLVKKILKKPELDSSKRGSSVKKLLGQAVASMPTAHRLVARKDHRKLAEALPVISAIANNKARVETYSVDPAGYPDLEDLYCKVDLFDQTLFHLVALNHDYSALVMLMEHNTIKPEDCVAKDIQGLTPLYIILLNTQHPNKQNAHIALAMLKRLLKQGWLKLNESLLGGETLLHFAVRTNNLALCKLLISITANVNVTNPIDGNTPLHYACQYNYPLIAELLLNHDASVYASNKKGLVARQLAVQNGAKETLVCLSQYQTEKEKTLSTEEWISLGVDARAFVLPEGDAKKSLYDQEISREQEKKVSSSLSGGDTEVEREKPSVVAGKIKTGSSVESKGNEDPKSHEASKAPSKISPLREGVLFFQKSHERKQRSDVAATGAAAASTPSKYPPPILRAKSAPAFLKLTRPLDTKLHKVHSLDNLSTRSSRGFYYTPLGHARLKKL